MTPEEWYQRMVEEQDAGKWCGAATICPDCHRPITSFATHSVTRKPTCRCGVKPLPTEVIMEIHGLASLYGVRIV